jgi:hypothetical protein
MNTNDLDPAAITVGKSEVFRLGGARGRRIESVLGSVWITIDGDPRDIVLDTGEGFSVDRDGDMLISALRADARIVLLDPATAG